MGLRQRQLVALWIVEVAVPVPRPARVPELAYLAHPLDLAAELTHRLGEIRDGKRDAVDTRRVLLRHR